MSDLIVSMHSARPVPEDAVVVTARERKLVQQGGSRATVIEIGGIPGEERGSFLPARATGPTEEVRSAPRAVRNLADLAPLHLPSPLTAPSNVETTSATIPGHRYRLASEAYENAAGLDRPPRKLLSISA